MIPNDLERACARLAIFPLPNTVLLLGPALPLHVFEPRYRQLVKDLAAGGYLAIPQMVPDNETGLTPPYLPYAGVGRILAHREMDDGRYNILVEPIARVRLEDEITGQPEPYRLGRAVLLRDAPHTPRDLEHVGARILALVGPMLGQMGDRAAELRQGLSELPRSRVADAVAPFVLRDSDERQAYLAENNPVERASLVETAVLEVLGGIGGGVADA